MADEQPTLEEEFETTLDLELSEQTSDSSDGGDRVLAKLTAKAVETDPGLIELGAAHSNPDEK